MIRNICLVLLAIALLISMIAVISCQQQAEGPTVPSKSSTPEVQHPSSSGLLYEDDFSDSSSGWLQESVESHECGYEDGEYHILMKTFTWFWVWNRNAGWHTDFALEVDARLISGPEESCYGVNFRIQDTEAENYYRFLVSGDGSYAMGKITEGVWTVLQDFEESDFIKKGNNTNHLKVVCQGFQIDVYVNGHHLTTVTDNSFAEGSVGMVVDRAGRGTHVAFDNLRIYKPSTGPEPTPTITQTSTPVETTPSPPYTIVDKAFEADYKGDCVTDVQITKVDGDELLFTLSEGSVIHMSEGQLVLWGYGAKHTWIGKLVYAGYTFDSDANDPLQFMVDKEKGYVYVKGKGVVTEPDGKKVSLPESTLEEMPQQQVTGSDAQLRIVVDKIERYNRDFPESAEGHYGVRPLKSDEGVDSIVIYLTIVPMRDVCVGYQEDTMEGFLQESVLADTDGNECAIYQITWGTILPLLGSSCRGGDFGEEATAELTFPFPEYATPATLKLIYSFLEPGEDKSWQKGQIDIPL